MKKAFHRVMTMTIVVGTLICFSCGGSGDGGKFSYNKIRVTKGCLNEPRARYVAALTRGKVLLAGGINLLSSALDTAEIFDPATGIFKKLSTSMSTPRDGAVAVTLADGRVLIAGGRNSEFAPLSSAELYDPQTESFRLTKSSMKDARYLPEAALLPDGKVLIVGGVDPSGSSLSSSEIYDPVQDSFVPAASLNIPRYQHFLTTLTDGRIAVFGGVKYEAGEAEFLKSVEIYDPTTEKFSIAGNTLKERVAGRATLSNGKVLVSGGYGIKTVYADVELWDPATGLSSGVGAMSSPRFYHVSVGLEDGRVLVAGGYADYRYLNPTATADIYDPTTGNIVPTRVPMMQARALIGEVVLPDGKVLMAGGFDPDDGVHATAEVFDPLIGSFASAGGQREPRMYQATVALPNGSVLLTGGLGFKETPLDTAEVYDPVSEMFSTVGPMAVSRFGHSSIILTNGKALITGGNSEEKRGELFDPVSRTFSFTQGLMTEFRYYAASSVLSDGRVLLAGGGNDDGPLADAEIYDPVTDTFAKTASMSAPRVGAVAIKLSNGKVLILGGSSTGSYSDGLASADLFDPEQETFVSTGPMREARTFFTASPLPDGRVLVAGGLSKTGSTIKTAEIYDPAKGQFEEVVDMIASRMQHAAAVLDDGSILLAGGAAINPPTQKTLLSVTSTEIFDPRTKSFKQGPSLSFPRHGHSAVPLPSGDILMLGGGYYPGVLDLSSWWALGSSELLEKN